MVGRHISLYLFIYAVGVRICPESRLGGTCGVLARQARPSEPRVDDLHVFRFHRHENEGLPGNPSAMSLPFTSYRQNGKSARRNPRDRQMSALFTPPLTGCRETLPSTGLYLPLTVFLDVPETAWE